MKEEKGGEFWNWDEGTEGPEKVIKSRRLMMGHWKKTGIAYGKWFRKRPSEEAEDSFACQLSCVYILCGFNLVLLEYFSVFFCGKIQLNNSIVATFSLKLTCETHPFISTMDILVGQKISSTVQCYKRLSSGKNERRQVTKQSLEGVTIGLFFNKRIPMWKIATKKIETEWGGFEMWSMSLILQPRTPNQKQQAEDEK